MKSLRSSILLWFALLVPLSSMELSLRDAWILASDHSPDLMEQRARLNGTIMNFQRQWTQFLPQLSFSASTTDSIRYNSPDSQQYSFSAQVQQPIFNGGRTLAERRVTRMQIGQQQNQFSLQEEELLDQVWDLYYGIVSQQKKIDLYQRSLDVVTQQMAVSTVQFNLGELTELDFLEAQIHLSSFQAEIAKEETLLMQMEYQLKRILDIDQEEELVLTDDLPLDYQGIDLPYDVDHLYSIALSNNLSIREAQLNLNTLQTQIRLDRLAYLPAISLKGSYKLSDDDLPLQNQSYSISLEIRFPFKNLPVTASIGYTESPDSEYSTMQNYSTQLPTDISHVANRRVSLMSFEASSDRLESVMRGLYSDLYFFMENLEQEKNLLQLLREEWFLALRKSELMRLQLELGEIKLTDYLEQENLVAQKEYAIIEALQSLKRKERELEIILGLPMGDISGEYPL